MEQIKHRSMACNPAGYEVSKMNRTTPATAPGLMALAPIVHDIQNIVGWAIVAMGMVELLHNVARAI